MISDVLSDAVDKIDSYLQDKVFEPAYRDIQNEITKVQLVMDTLRLYFDTPPNSANKLPAEAEDLLKAIQGLDLSQLQAARYSFYRKVSLSATGAGRSDSGAMQKCYDCGAIPGSLHEPGCDVERCPACGRQFITCDCPPRSKKPRLPWSGIWPGEAEAREWGWYCKRVPGVPGYVPCDEGEPGAGPDINRVLAEAKWDRRARRFVR